MLAKLANIKGSFIAYHDSEMKLVRMMDAAVRLFLRHQPAHKEKSEALDNSLAELSGITTKLKSMALISYIEPGDNKEYSVYRKEQDLLSAQARRLQSTVSRYTAEKKKEKEETKQDQSALQAENDALKAELAKAKGEQIGNFRQLFQEMTKADKAEAKKNKNKNNEGDWQEKGRKKGGSGAGKGKGKGKGGGKGGGRKKGKGK